MRIIMRRYSTTASSAGPASRSASATSVNGTTVTERSACQRASMLAQRQHLVARLLADVTAASESRRASSASPRLAASQPATGESMPPESSSSAAARRADRQPAGRGARRRRRRTRGRSRPRRRWSAPGVCTSTGSPVASTTRAPTTRARSPATRIGKRLSARRALDLEAGRRRSARRARRRARRSPIACRSRRCRAGTRARHRERHQAEDPLEPRGGVVDVAGVGVRRRCGRGCCRRRRRADRATAARTLSASARSKRRRLPLFRKSSP